MISTMARPTPTSAAATAMMNRANTAPATSPCIAPNAIRLMLTALRMSSIDISTSTVFLRAMTPYTPVQKRIAPSSRNWLRISSSTASPVLPGDDDGADQRGEQQHRDDLERDQVLGEDRVAHGGRVAAGVGARGLVDRRDPHVGRQRVVA